MRDAFIKALEKLADDDPRIFLITGDLGFGVLDRFATLRPRQFLNAGVAEQNMTGLATGLALEGRIVFTYSIANFPILRPLEFIRNDAAYHDANVNVVAIGGGFSYGALGISHHATEDLAIMRSLPGMVVASPCCDWEATELVPALAGATGTSYLRLDRLSAGNTRQPGERFALGRIRVLEEGTDLTIAATGGIMAEVLAATASLRHKGVTCRVLSVHTIKPLDLPALVAAARETGGILTVEEHTVDGGLGGAVAEALLEAGAVPRVFRRIGLRAGFSSIVGSQQYLRSVYGMDAESIAREAAAMLSTRPSSPAR